MAESRASWPGSRRPCMASGCSSPRGPVQSQRSLFGIPLRRSRLPVCAGAVVAQVARPSARASGSLLPRCTLVLRTVAILRQSAGHGGEHVGVGVWPGCGDPGSCVLRVPGRPSRPPTRPARAGSAALDPPARRGPAGVCGGKGHQTRQRSRAHRPSVLLAHSRRSLGADDRQGGMHWHRSRRGGGNAGPGSIRTAGAGVCPGWL